MTKKTLVVTVMCALMFSVFAFTGFASPQAFAAKKGTNVSRTRQYAIIWLDSNFHIARVWKGSIADAQPILQHERAIRIKHQPARHQPDNFGISPDINRVFGCTDPNSFWDLRNYPPLVCFANNGVININVYQVYEIDTGNNAGNFVAYNNVHFPGNGLQFCSYTSIFPPSGTTFYDITQVTITGRTAYPCQG